MIKKSVHVIIVINDNKGCGVKKIGIQTTFCIIMLLAQIPIESCDNYDDKNLPIEQITTESDDPDVERTTEVTVQTPWLYVKMLSDDPFVQVTLGCATLLVISTIVLVGHHLYTSGQK